MFNHSSFDFLDSMRLHTEASNLNIRSRCNIILLHAVQLLPRWWNCCCRASCELFSNYLSFLFFAFYSPFFQGSHALSPAWDSVGAPFYFHSLMLFGEWISYVHGVIPPIATHLCVARSACQSLWLSLCFYEPWIVVYLAMKIWDTASFPLKKSTLFYLHQFNPKF